MVLITISVVSTVIENMVTTDAAIQAALRATGDITNVYHASVIPISNTKSRVFIVYDHSG